MKRPQFSLKDLFWLLVVAGMACAWWVDRSRTMAQWNAKVQKAILEAGGSLEIIGGEPVVLTMSADGLLMRPNDPASESP